ncbi:MAG: TonB-dependent receptor, partial [Muribaculaceae bacterium]|nr:TonB-dependent receptor [Muribaculaceae bacterium]
RFVEKGDYLRLKNVQLGYTLPNHIAHKMGMSKWRIYVSGSNLLTFTKYKGYDPEVAAGVDYGNYPQARTFMFGTNISF